MDLVDKRKRIGNATIRCSLDEAETAARGIHSAVILERPAWIQISRCEQEVQRQVPFDGEHLFGTNRGNVRKNQKGSGKN